ncbi:MAG: hypothetical protein ACRCXZ_07320 [Patescibacteria group bacterium]
MRIPPSFSSSHFAKENKDNSCFQKKDSTKTLECKIKMGDQNESNLSLTLFDQVNNKTVLLPSVVKYIEPLTLNCNEDRIANQGVVLCESNRKVSGSLTMDDKKIDFKDTITIEKSIENQETKSFKINLQAKDEFGFKKEFVKDILVDRTPFDAQMWVERSPQDNNGTRFKVFAKANKDAEFEAYSYGTLHEYDIMSGKTKKTPLPSYRARIFQRSDLPKGEVTLVKNDNHPATGCVETCAEVYYTINIHPINDPNKVIKYTCRAGIIPQIITSCSKN